MPGDRKPTKEFWDKHYAILKKENKDYSDETISKIVATMWQNAGPEAKAKYNKIRAKRESMEKGFQHYVNIEPTCAHFVAIENEGCRQPENSGIIEVVKI
jgi:hypothetical protein